MKRFEGHTASLQLIPRAPGSHCKFLNKRVIWPEVEGWPGGRQGQICAYDRAERGLTQDSGCVKRRDKIYCHPDRRAHFQLSLELAVTL